MKNVDSPNLPTTYADRHVLRHKLISITKLNCDNVHLQVLHTYFIHSRIEIILHALWLDLEVKKHHALFLVFT